MERQTLIRDCVDKIIVYHDGRVEIFTLFTPRMRAKRVRKKVHEASKNLKNGKSVAVDFTDS